MPTKTLYRTWCSTCKDWELFERPWLNKDLEDDEKEMSCEKCGTKLDRTTKIGDIPVEKLREQRVRYKAYKKEEFARMYSMFAAMASNPNRNMFSETIGETEIVENDAGQKHIDEEGARLRKEQIDKNKEEYSKYRHVGRNEKCPCGSEKKYKKCCQERIQNLELK